MTQNSELNPSPKWTVPNYLQCFCGTIFFGVVVPTILVWLNGKGRENFFNGPFPSNRLQLDDLFFTLFYATISVGPGSLLLSLLMLAKVKKCESKGLRERALHGATWGAGTAFLNLPGYAVVWLLHGSALQILATVIILYGVAGFLSGAWVAWCHYSFQYCESQFIPSFSLATLLSASITVTALATFFFLS